MNPKSIKEPILLYLKELKPALQKEGIVKIGLFGSFAKDEATINSDIDIFIRTTEAFCKKYRGFAGFSFLADLRKNIAEHFDKKVDLCDIKDFNKERRIKILDGAIYA